MAVQKVKETGALTAPTAVDMSANTTEIRHTHGEKRKAGTEIRFLGRILGEIIREQAGQTLYDLEEEIRLGSRARRERNTGGGSGRCARASAP